MRFTISRRISLGFGLFIAVVAFVFVLTNTTLQKSRAINDRINREFAPSLTYLQQLDNDLMRSQDLVRQWAFVQRREDDSERLELQRLTDSILPSRLREIKVFAMDWEPGRQERFTQLEAAVVRMISDYREVQELLPDFDSYADPLRVMMAEDYFVSGTHIPEAYSIIRNDLGDLISQQRSIMSAEIERMNTSFSNLSLYLVNISFGVLIAGLLIAFFTSRSIVVPVNSLRRKLANLSQGIYSVHPTKAGNDEIGDMALAVNKLITSFEKTKEFSINVGAGNFLVDYAPLSEHDEMGKALLRMRDDLSSYRHEMEAKVDAQTQEIRRQKEEVEHQKEKVTELYQDLRASIAYAQRLQETILPNDEMIRQMFPDSFVFYRPKATVSGDFYWFKQQGGKKIFAAADCTGHGVPGAFMSLVGHNVLNQVTKVFTRPSQILNNVNRLSAEVMRADQDEGTRDGMDIAICSLDPRTLELEFSGAHNPLYIVRNGELTEIESDPFSIGSLTGGDKEFTNHVHQLQEGDCLYLFSDGYADQFGGPKNKKFMRKHFRMLLLQIHHLPMAEQKWRLAETLDRWKGESEQIDDILVLGVRV